MVSCRQETEDANRDAYVVTMRVGVIKYFSSGKGALVRMSDRRLPMMGNCAVWFEERSNKTKKAR